MPHGFQQDRTAELQEILDDERSPFGLKVHAARELGVDPPTRPIITPQRQRLKTNAELIIADQEQHQKFLDKRQKEDAQLEKLIKERPKPPHPIPPKKP